MRSHDPDEPGQRGLRGLAGERVFVGLGGNLGDAQAAVLDALERLAHLPRTRLVARSSLYRSTPVDAGGPDFVNAVAELATALDPRDLLQALQAIERAHRRERPYRNAPRTLDLDLLLYGGRTLDTPDLALPHPRMHERAFVLVPLAELAPDLVLPGHGAVQTLAHALRDQAVHRIRDLS